MRTLLLPLALAAALGLGACADRAPTPDGTADVVVAFYPLQFVVERVGGDAVRVESLTAPGAEPHDLELTPKQVGRLSKADLVVHIEGFQPAVDTAVEQQAPSRGLDVAGLTEPDEANDDPHVWLDPVRFAAIAEAVAARLADVEPSRAATFMANAAALRAQLSTLDADFRTGLTTCARRTFVTSHNSFGYLAARYGLEQVALTGLTPEDEPSPATVARVARFAEANRVTTIFFEELVSPDVARTLADEVGATALELSPLETRPETGDYLTQMRSTLAALRTALGCT
jgi:zinc transport system substrate-binding protein